MNLLGFAAISSLVLAPFFAQDAKKGRYTHPVSKDADGGMARWMETCKPSAAHARLKELLGTYDYTVRMFMSPNAPPLESKGTAEIAWLADGKWIQTRWTADVMGQKTNGWQTLGFDNFKQRFVLSAVDSMQTTIVHASGHFDASGDHLILWGTIDEPMTGEQDKQVKYVYRNFGQDAFTVEVHDMMIGESNTKVVEIAFTRKK